MDNSLAQLSYDAALRSLDKQEQLLSELRARTGILLAASSLAASFLGRPALDDAQPFLAGIALAAFAVSIGASVYVLIPKKGLILALAGPPIFEGLFEFRHDLAEVYRRLAYDLDRFWESNDRVMVKLFRGYRLAAGALATEVLLLLASVSDTLF